MLLHNSLSLKAVYVINIALYAYGMVNLKSKCIIELKGNENIAEHYCVKVD